MFYGVVMLKIEMEENNPDVINIIFLEIFQEVMIGQNNSI